MKKNKIIILIVALLLVVGIVVASILYFFPSAEKTKTNIFMCNTVSDVESFVLENNIAHEKHDNSLHLFNMKYESYLGYCVIEFGSDDEGISRIDFYMNFENNNDLTKEIEDVKNVFLDEFGFEGEYEYFPVDTSAENVGEQDFLDRKASKELFVYEENQTWNISWYITDENVSARISKSVF